MDERSISVILCVASEWVPLMSIQVLFACYFTSNCQWKAILFIHTYTHTRKKKKRKHFYFVKRPSIIFVIRLLIHSWFIRCKDVISDCRTLLLLSTQNCWHSNWHFFVANQCVCFVHDFCHTTHHWEDGQSDQVPTWSHSILWVFVSINVIKLSVHVMISNDLFVFYLLHLINGPIVWENQWKFWNSFILFLVDIIIQFIVHVK